MDCRCFGLALRRGFAMQHRTTQCLQNGGPQFLFRGRYALRFDIKRLPIEKIAAILILHFLFTNDAIGK